MKNILAISFALTLLGVAPVAASETTAPDRAPRAESSRVVGPLTQQAIFEILCGGMEAQEGALARHLWDVAGSLADRGWTPPKVTVRVVAAATDG